MLKIAAINHKYIPLIIDAQSWQSRNEIIGKKNAIFEWLTLRLKEEYSSFKSKSIARKFLEDNLNNIIFLIDGLDNLELEKQRQMIKDINIFLSDSTSKMVLCCRTSDYQRCRVLLGLNSAVHLQFLGESEICEYLRDVVSLEDLEIIRKDLNILEVIKNPLFLFQLKTILASESDTSFVEILQATPYQNIRQLYCHLFDRYIENIANSNLFGKIPTSITIRWLIILAKIMKEEKKPEFLIEKMQPSWFKGLKSTKQRKESQRLNALIAGLMSLVPAITIGILFDNGRFAQSSFFPKHTIIFLSPAIFSGASAAIAYNILEITLIESLELSFPKIRKSFSHIYIHWKEHILGAVFGNVIATSTNEVNQLLEHLKKSEGIVLFRTIAGTMVSSIITWISSIFQNSELKIEERDYANKGVIKTFFNATLLTFVIGVFSFVSAAFIQYFTNNTYDSQNRYRFVLETGCIGFLAGIISGILSVGLPFVQHFSLRFTLCKHGYIPWNYARFLNHAAIKYKFLQRTGGSYRFVHPLLQEHFANMDIGENHTEDPKCTI